EGQYREACDRYVEALRHLPVGHHLYYIGWHQLFGLKVKHLKVTGEILPMPAPPRIADLIAKKKDWPPFDLKELKSMPDKLHPSSYVNWLSLPLGGVAGSLAHDSTR